MLYRVRDLGPAALDAQKVDIAASFEAAVVDVLVKKTVQAAAVANTPKILLSGGVAANRRLRSQLAATAVDHEMRVFYPSIRLCTDNAAMIAGVGAFRLGRGERSGFDLNADPRLPLPGLREGVGCKTLN